MIRNKTRNKLNLQRDTERVKEKDLQIVLEK